MLILAYALCFSLSKERSAMCIWRAEGIEVSIIETILTAVNVGINSIDQKIKKKLHTYLHPLWLIFR